VYQSPDVDNVDRASSLEVFLGLLNNQNIQQLQILLGRTIHANPHPF